VQKLGFPVMTGIGSQCGDDLHRGGERYERSLKIWIDAGPLWYTHNFAYLYLSIKKIFFGGVRYGRLF